MENPFIEDKENGQDATNRCKKGILGVCKAQRVGSMGEMVVRCEAKDEGSSGTTRTSSIEYLSKIRVCLRVRPTLTHEGPWEDASAPLDDKEASIVRIKNSTCVSIQNPRNAQNCVEFSFDSCHNSRATQLDIFERDVAPILPHFLDGYNMTLFAYGNTGAGKTYTMEGTASNLGMIPLSVKRLFQLLPDGAHLQLSFLEIYNEKVYDLLVAQPSCSKGLTDLVIREDAHKNILVPNMTKVELKNVDDFERWWSLGRKNRTTAATKLNATSSRSHSILILQATARECGQAKGTQKGPFVPSKLHLIDLAGSEDNRRTNNKGVRMLESSNINRSLFVLGKVVDALNVGAGRDRGDEAAPGRLSDGIRPSSSGSTIRIPYRDSKLTRLLQDSLGGRAIAVMIVAVSPLKDHFLETFNTLTFAAKSKQISNQIQRQDMILKEEAFCMNHINLTRHNGGTKSSILVKGKEASKRSSDAMEKQEEDDDCGGSLKKLSERKFQEMARRSLSSVFSTSKDTCTNAVEQTNHHDSLDAKLEALLLQKLQNGSGFLTPIIEQKFKSSFKEHLRHGSDGPSMDGGTKKGMHSLLKQALTRKHQQPRSYSEPAQDSLDDDDLQFSTSVNDFMTPNTRSKTARCIVKKALDFENMAILTSSTIDLEKSLKNFELAQRLLPKHEQLQNKIESLRNRLLAESTLRTRTNTTTTTNMQRNLTTFSTASASPPTVQVAEVAPETPIRPTAKKRKKTSSGSLSIKEQESKDDAQYDYERPSKNIIEMTADELSTYIELCLMSVLNFGTKKQVMALPGIGAKRFEKLLTDRNTNGLFRGIEELSDRLGWPASFCQSLTQSLLAKRLMNRI